MAKEKSQKPRSKGQPKKFQDGQEFIELFQAFCDNIAQKGFLQVPTQTNFCKWLGKNYSAVDRRTIYNSLNQYFPTIKKEFEQLQSDLIAEGAMLGRYQPTMSIFALKNWCEWKDRPIENNTTEAEDRLAQAFRSVFGEVKHGTDK